MKFCFWMLKISRDLADGFRQVLWDIRVCTHYYIIIEFQFRNKLVIS